jgi:hypothetical protein
MRRNGIGSELADSTMRLVRCLSPLLLPVLFVQPAVATAAQEATVAPDKAQAAAARAELRPARVQQTPVIDGVLDDDAWSAGPIKTGPWTSCNPLYGDSIRQQTNVWMAYDADYIYLAFQCDDPEPAAIKSSITRRDNIWSDDWVGVSRR